MQLGSPNLTQKCSTTSPEKHLFWGQKVKGQGHQAQKTVPAWVCALLWVHCWLLSIVLVVMMTLMTTVAIDRVIMMMMTLLVRMRGYGDGFQSHVRRCATPLRRLPRHVHQLYTRRQESRDCLPWRRRRLRPQFPQRHPRGTSMGCHRRVFQESLNVSK